MSQQKKNDMIDGIESDIQQFIDATTNLASATVQPIVRLIDGLGRSIGDDSQPPRASLGRLSTTGTELIESSVRLVEKVMSRGLDMLRARPEDGKAMVASVPTVAAGATLTIPFMVENPTDQPMTDMEFYVATLTGPTDSTLTGKAFSFAPATLTVAPKNFEKLEVGIRVPADAAVAQYAGTLGIRSRKNFRMSFRFEVIA